MKNTNFSKRSLVVSVLALFICFAMLLGTTFAWFTDTATSTNNVIKTGTFELAVSWAEGTEDPDNANWANADTGAIFNHDKWEPGYVDVKHIKIENKGNLALKYMVKIVANGEVTDLSDVIDVYYSDPAVQVTDRASLGTKLGTLTEVLAGMETTAAGKLLEGETDTITLALKMQESAGNEYINKSIGTDFSVIFLATQVAHEEDGLGTNDYDNDASYVDTYANNEASLAEALANGGAVALTADVAVSNVLTVAADTTIYLNGHDLDASANTSRPFNVADGVKLTINAEGADIKVGKYGFVNVPAGNDATVVINGGNFTANTDNGSFIKARGTGNIVVTLNNVNYVDASANGGWIANAVESSVGNFELNVNGGTFEAYNGFSSVEKLSVKNATVKVKHNGVYNSSGEAVVDGCTIICTNEGTTQEQSAAPASCVAVSSNCTFTVKNSTLISENGEATAVYTSGGTMALENCTVTGAYAHYVTGKYADAQFATTVDGVAANVVVH